MLEHADRKTSGKCHAVEGTQRVLAEDHLSNQEQREELGDPKVPSGSGGYSPAYI